MTSENDAEKIGKEVAENIKKMVSWYRLHRWSGYVADATLIIVGYITFKQYSPFMGILMMVAGLPHLEEIYIMFKKMKNARADKIHLRRKGEGDQGDWGSNSIIEAHIDVDR